jgi:thioredoxin 1
MSNSKSINRMQDINTLEELNSYSKSIPSTLIVLYFKAVWCGPCKDIKPFILYLQENYPKVEFIEIDIEDEFRDTIVAKFNIKKVPTFIFYKNSEICSSLLGTNKDNLEALVNEHL